MIRLALILITLFNSALFATELPNKCSRDQNPNEFTILSYHEIADKSETPDSSYAVAPSDFDQQIRWLIDSGYHFIFLSLKQSGLCDQ